MIDPTNCSLLIQTTQTNRKKNNKQTNRRWKGGSIEPHPTDKALIVNYQLEATVFGEPNNPMIEEKKVRTSSMHCEKISVVTRVL